MKRLCAVLLSLALCCALACPALGETDKDETVYILADAQGAARKIIVSDWLKNPQGADTLPDVSTLENIENVKGLETFENGLWNAAGKDIYYQGESQAQLPLEMRVSYALDGQEIAPEALAGKSGRVTIRFDFTVSQKQAGVSVPFAVVTAALLENDVFTDVQVTNGQLVNDGERTLVVGAALPGLQSSLGLTEDQLALPEYVEISAQAEGFALPVTAALASCEPFAQLPVERLDSVEDLKQAAKKLDDGMARLIDGGTQLYDGLATLETKSGELAQGVSQLNDGLAQLTAQNDTLNSACDQVFAALLAAANEQLAAASPDAPALTQENYAAVLDQLIAALSPEGVAAAARQQVEQAVRQQEDTIRQAVEAAVREQAAAQVRQAVEEGVREKALAALDTTPEAYATALEAGKIPQEQQQQLAAALEQQMASDAVQALIQQQTDAQMQSQEAVQAVAQNVEAQVQALVEQQMQSDAVQAQVQAAEAQYQSALESLTALRGQLESFQAFHDGLAAYTQGAASAAAGAAQINEAMPALTQGVSQLRSGAMQLKTGLTVLNASGIQRITGLAGDDLDDLMARVRAIVAAAQDYQSFSGVAPSAQGAVRFIWRTDAIEAK